jgi:7-carboxy-7-deazaguanine synthase
MTPASLVEDIQATSYPVAEVFDSLQGEGRWAGTFMRFVRLAGCNVGVPRNRELNNLLQIKGIAESFLHSPEADHHTACRIWDGTHMLCDTNYQMSEKRTVESLLNHELGIQHLCITGGEPFLHDLSPLIFAAQSKGMMVHIETSGTKPMMLHGMINRSKLWVTWSPKWGASMDCAEVVDECKLLIHRDIPALRVIDWALDYQEHGGDKERIYLQPVTGYIDRPADRACIQKCIDIIMMHPQLKLSLQLHKYLEVR